VLAVDGGSPAHDDVETQDPNCISSAYSDDEESSLRLHARALASATTRLFIALVLQEYESSPFESAVVAFHRPSHCHPRGCLGGRSEL